MEKEEYPVWTGDHFLYTPENPAWVSKMKGITAIPYEPIQMEEEK